MKKNKKNISASDERIFITESDMALLTKGERWMPKAGNDGGKSCAEIGSVQELVEVPCVDLKDIDIEFSSVCDDEIDSAIMEGIYLWQLIYRI